MNGDFMEEKVYLNFEKPIVRCYNHHAFPTGLINGNYKEKGWIYNYFYTIYFDRDARRKVDMKCDYFFEKENVFIKGYYIVPKLVNQSGDFVSFLKSLISGGNSIAGIYDEFYLKHADTYQKLHFMHNFLLHGFDDKKNAFISSGYVRDRMDAMWKTFEIPYKDFCEAVECEDGVICFNTFAPIIGHVNEMRTDNLKRGLEEYLYPPNKDGILYGIDAMKSYINFISIQMIERGKMHIPSMYATYEYRKIMLERLWHMAEIKIGPYCFYEKYKKIYTKAKIMLNIFLKYCIKPMDSLAKKIKAYGEEMLLEELMLYEEILNFIQRGYS